MQRTTGWHLAASRPSMPLSMCFAPCDPSMVQRLCRRLLEKPACPRARSIGISSFIHAGLAVQKERSGRYDLGPEAAELGVAALSRNHFVVRAAEGLEELAESTGQAA